MRRFILAPDSFKGTMTAPEICDILADVVKELVPTAETVKIPMSDGGEGMVEAYLKLLGGEKRFALVTGPDGRPVNCPYGILPDGTAVMEMAGCAGLPLMEGRLDPLHATTYGVGELLRLLSASGCRRVLMGIGGSATNDCGVGMAAALGYLGVIENDFHDRPDLTPNVCAVYVEKAYRCRGIAGKLLEAVCRDMHSFGIDTLYLLTMHTSFYERYNWRHICMVQGDGDEELSRMYMHTM